MISLSAPAAAALALVAGGWLALAIWLSWRASRRAGAAAGGAELAKMQALLAAGPSAPLLVRRDGKLSSVGQGASLLGLAAMPTRLDQLTGPDGIFAEQEGEALAGRVRQAMRNGASALLVARPLRTSRVLRIDIAPAPPELGAGAALLWLTDVTAGEARAEAAAEAAARQEAALDALTRLIEAAPFPVWLRSPDLQLALVNGAYVRAVEAPDAAAVVASGIELVDEADGRNALREAADVRDAGAPAFRTVPATVAGARRMMQILELPLGPAGVAGFAIDIEEQEQARAELTRFQSAQRDLLDRLSAGVVQFGRDRAVMFFNQPFARLFGLEADFLADRPEFDRVIDAMRDARKLPEPRDFPSWKAERREWFTAGLAAIEEDWELPDRRHLRVLAQPLPDGGLLVIFEDRTRQIMLESDRERMVQVQTTTFDNLAEGIAVFASNRRLKLWNNRFRMLWGLEPDALADAPTVEALAAQLGGVARRSRQAGIVRELVRAAIVNRRARTGRLSLTDGRELELAAIPIPADDVLFTTLDVTDSHRVETALRDRTAALEEADRLKTAFMSNISYELRTPLTSIAGFAEMMAGGYAGEIPAAARDYIAAILDSVAGLSALIDDILDLTQSDVGGLLLAEEEVDVAELVDGMLDDARAAAAAKPVRLEAALDSSGGVITGDRRRLAQAVMNLVRHAVQATPAGAIVRLGVAGDEAASRIAVTDSGPGIEPAEQSRIFDRFQPGTAGAGGIGLELPLARQFVEAHGGTLTVQSEPGAGATFTITLPRTAEQRQAYAAAAAAVTNGEDKAAEA